MARGGSLPPGFRFHPTDVELILYYLKKKISGKALRFEVIAELDIYKFAPWDLPDKSIVKSKDLEWYFFCPRDKKYGCGPRMNRATEVGYWKTTGRDRDICNDSRRVGWKKTLVFHVGRAPRGDRTNWVMHEYRLDDKNLVDAGICQDSYVLCKFFEKSGVGPKNGEQHGAPFKEEDWEDDEVTDTPEYFQSLVPVTSPAIRSNGKDSTCCSSIAVTCQSDLSNTEVENPPVLEDDIERLMAFFKDDDAHYVDGSDNNKGPDPSTFEGIIEAPAVVDGIDIYDGLEDLRSRTSQSLTDNFLLSNSPGEDFFLNQAAAGDNLCYLELDDLSHPLNFPEGVPGSECSQVQNHFDRYQSCDNVDALWDHPSAPSNAALPSREVCNVCSLLMIFRQ
ncbi:hypothetical protein MKW94_024841 [Papaver nudicaule]|uniref:NAC domain-containing protein n=1 Tax=Papaver nudicaule TaxID=74823 RepID=A0AA41S0D4_PAPNU|nr:hypothetical protein [Papaver nudicaule]